MLVRDVPDPAAALAPMRRLLRGADLTVGNLESTLSTDGEPQQGNDSFGGSPALVPVLEGRGLRRAVAGQQPHRRLRRAGAAADRAHPAAEPDPAVRGAATTWPRRPSPPCSRRRTGRRTRSSASTRSARRRWRPDDSPGALSVRMPPRTGPLDADDLRRVTRAVRQAQREADVVVVLPHWGTQYTHVPVPEQRTVARRLVAAGADLVVGGHPHWVQGVDAVDGVPVAPLPRQLRLRHGPHPRPQGRLHDRDHGGRRPRGDVLGPRAQGDPAAALPDGRRQRSRRAASRGADVLADVWSTSTGPFAG